MKDSDLLRSAEKAIHEVVEHGYREPIGMPIGIYMRVPKDTPLAMMLATTFQQASEEKISSPLVYNSIVSMARYIMLGTWEKE